MGDECWACGGPGTLKNYTLNCWRCEACQVEWVDPGYWTSRRQGFEGAEQSTRHSEQVFCNIFFTDLVDFTRPDAPCSPA